MSVKFSHGKKHFEIKREFVRGSYLFVGYINGKRSVTGPRAHVAARVLIAKHVTRAPKALLLHFPPQRHREYEDGVSLESDSDLAG